MSEYKHLAKISDTFLGWEDHGIFTAWIGVDYETGGHQGIGIHSLGSAKHGYDNAGGYIAALMAAVGVEQWEHLAGKMVYVLANNEYPLTGTNIIGVQGLSFKREGKRFVFEEWRESLAVVA